MQNKMEFIFIFEREYLRAKLKDSANRMKNQIFFGFS